MNRTRGRKSPALFAVHLVCAGWFTMRAVIWEMPDLSSKKVLAASVAGQMPPTNMTIQKTNIAHDPGIRPTTLLATSILMRPRGTALQLTSGNRADHISKSTRTPQFQILVQSANNRNISLENTALQFQLTALALSPPSPQLGSALAPASHAKPSFLTTLTVDAWSILRGQAAGSSLSPQGTLGGSQLGLRARLPLVRSGSGRTVSATASFSSPLSSGEGQEVAFGLAARPARSLPIELIVEQRVSLDGPDRSRLVALAAGGIDDVPLIHNLTVSSYAQIGVAGLNRRDLFADGNAIVRGTLSQDGTKRVSAGIGIWGSAQPGLARVDVGPMIEARKRLGTLPVTVGLQWRVHVAGNAGPGSGPALTLATGF